MKMPPKPPKDMPKDMPAGPGGGKGKGMPPGMPPRPPKPTVSGKGTKIEIPTRLPEAIWGKKFPKIIIDHTKCTVPFLCKKCLQVCPEAIFSVMEAMGSQKRLKETDPRIDGNYVLGVSRRDRCTVCNKCIEVCPVDAIKIEVA